MDGVMAAGRRTGRGPRGPSGRCAGPWTNALRTTLTIRASLAVRTAPAPAPHAAGHPMGKPAGPLAHLSRSAFGFRSFRASGRFAGRRGFGVYRSLSPFFPFCRLFFLLIQIHVDIAENHGLNVAVFVLVEQGSHGRRLFPPAFGVEPGGQRRGHVRKRNFFQLFGILGFGEMLRCVRQGVLGQVVHGLFRTRLRSHPQVLPPLPAEQLLRRPRLRVWPLELQRAAPRWDGKSGAGKRVPPQSARASPCVRVRRPRAQYRSRPSAHGASLPTAWRAEVFGKRFAGQHQWDTYRGRNASRRRDSGR